jgi:hypothetical protein
MPQGVLEAIESGHLDGAEMVYIFRFLIIQGPEHRAVSRSTVGVPNRLGDLVVGLPLSHQLQGS